MVCGGAGLWLAWGWWSADTYCVLPEAMAKSADNHVPSSRSPLGASAAVAIGLLLTLAFDPGVARAAGCERDQAAQRMTVREWTATLVRVVRGLGGGAETHKPVARAVGDGGGVPRVSAVRVPREIPADEAPPIVRPRVEVMDLPPPSAA